MNRCKENFNTIPKIPANNRILARDTFASNDGVINNNDCVIGSSGCGKTRSYVLPNILEAINNGQSLVIVDVKGDLLNKTIPFMNGYNVYNLDFRDYSGDGYNPLNIIRKNDTASIQEIAAILQPTDFDRDPFWPLTARIALECIIAYVIEFAIAEDKHMGTVAEQAGAYSPENFAEKFAIVEKANPCSFALKQYKRIANLSNAEKTDACCWQFANTALSPFIADGAVKMMTNEKQIDLASIGSHKTAVFVQISDFDRSKDGFISIFFSQLFGQLIKAADARADHRLAIPVRIILDDFGASFAIQDYDKLTSVIRSRGIAVSTILQSLMQLSTMYDEARARTIIQNHDSLLYLGGNDAETCAYIASLAGEDLKSIRELPIEEGWLFTRGKKAKKITRYDISQHPLWMERMSFDEKCNNRDYEEKLKEIEAERGEDEHIFIGF